MKRVNRDFYLFSDVEAFLFSHRWFEMALLVPKLALLIKLTMLSDENRAGDQGFDGGRNRQIEMVKWCVWCDRNGLEMSDQTMHKVRPIRGIPFGVLPHAQGCCRISWWIQYRNVLKSALKSNKKIWRAGGQIRGSSTTEVPLRKVSILENSNLFPNDNGRLSLWGKAFFFKGFL